MKKEFKLPQIELVLINEEDIIKTSAQINFINIPGEDGEY